MRGLVPVIAVLLLGGCAQEQGGVPASTPLSAEGARNRYPSFSPDGVHLAYWSPSADVAGQWELFVANADLSAPVNLGVRSLNFGASEPPLWSPDGTRIATVSSQFGAADVVVVPATGGEVQRVTHFPGIAIPVAWYPDGDRIAFCGLGFRDLPRILRARVHRNDAAALPGERRPSEGTPSPDGSHIAYLVTDGSRSTIWVADSSGGNRRQLTTEGFENISTNIIPWTPDGKEILYESRRTGMEDLWIVSIEDGKTRQLTHDVRRDFGEAVSPDGKWIAFLSDRGRQSDIWLVPTAGGPVQRVTDSREYEMYPLAWRPHSNELASPSTPGRAASGCATWPAAANGSSHRTRWTCRTSISRPTASGTSTRSIVAAAVATSSWPRSTAVYRHGRCSPASAP